MQEQRGHVHTKVQQHCRRCSVSSSCRQRLPLPCLQGNRGQVCASDHKGRMDLCLLCIYRQASVSLRAGKSAVPAVRAGLLRRAEGAQQPFGACFQAGSAGCPRLPDPALGHHEGMLSTTLATRACHTLEHRASQAIPSTAAWGCRDAAHCHKGTPVKLSVDPLTARGNTHPSAPSPVHRVSAAAPALLLRPLSPGCCPAAHQQSGTISFRHSSSSVAGLKLAGCQGKCGTVSCAHTAVQSGPMEF